MENYELRSSSRWKSRVLWPFIGWALFFSPLLLVLAGYCIPNMLRGLVLLRTENRATEYLWDCGCLTAMGMFVSTLGVAIIRVFDLYSVLQFGYQTDAKAIHGPLDRRTVDKWWWTSRSTAWPLAIVLLWVFVSVGYPLYCCCETRWDINQILQIDPNHTVPEVYWAGALLGVLGGAIVASVFLLMVSVVHLVWTRKSRSACGLLPFEELAAWILDRILGLVKDEQTPTDPFIAKPWVHALQWFLGRGFFNPSTTRVLPGHKQLVVFMAFAAFGYYMLFDSAYRKIGWTSSTYHVGVYALLIIFLLGGVAALLSFIFGRRRFHIASISIALCGTVLLAFLLVRLGGYVGLDTNRYFAIVPPKAKAEVNLKPLNIDSDDGAFVRIAKSKAVSNPVKEPLASDDADRKTLKDVYGKDNWQFPRGPDGKRTMVVVTTSGGGIQASAWTAKVLANMDAECSAFSESIGLVSGVSGGSVGSMYYLGKRGFRRNVRSEENKPPVYMAIAPRTRDAIQKAASDSSLEAIGWGLAFPDLARMVPGLNLKVNKEDDRGLALESQWWTRMGRDWTDAKKGTIDSEKEKEAILMGELRMRDLLPATNTGLIPPMIFNATTVETGQRTMIATFATNPEATSSKASMLFVEYERLSKPIDFFGFYEPLFLNPLDVNPRVSTAVRMSSSFAYVTPVARPTLPKSLLNPKPSNLLKLRANYHFCDGGYSENTGLVGAIRIITDLINQHIAEGSAPPFDRVLFLSIESFPDNVVETENDSTGISSGFLGPLSAIFGSRVASQAERAELELELLIRSEDQAYSKKSAAEIMAVFDVDKFESYRANAEQLVSRIDSSPKLDDDTKEMLTDLLSPVAKTNLRKVEQGLNKGMIPATQAQAIKDKAVKVFAQESILQESLPKILSADETSLVTTFIEQSRTLSQLDVPNDAPSIAAANSIFKLSIACIQFRFDPRQEAVVNERNQSKIDAKVPDPPLSWMLSPYDKYRIDVAWDKQIQRLKGTFAAAGPGKDDKDQRLMPPEMLQQILKFDKKDTQP